jgi:hypothetical protein
MKTDIRPSWLQMSERRLLAYLHHQSYPIPMITVILESVRATKEERRAMRIRATVGNKLWRNLLEPARTELGVVRTMKGQAKRASDESFEHAPTHAKYVALHEYDTLLAKLIERLRKVQMVGDYTPQQFAKELKAQGRMPASLDGDHWTDYVSAKEKKRINDLFDAAPAPKRGKEKRPFDKRISKSDHATQRQQLLARLKTELSNAEQEYEFALDPDEQDRLSALIQDMQEANFVIDTLPSTSPLPTTWRGLLSRNK